MNPSNATLAFATLAVLMLALAAWEAVWATGLAEFVVNLCL